MKNNKIMRYIITVVVILIPVIYSFFYLKSYWDPYGDLTGLKIAVVNLDEGENNENQGEEFINSLTQSGTFNICTSSVDEANEGMQNGEFYATITIPSNFTKCLNSASTTEKQIPTITYSPNQASNYLATQIINSAIKTIELNLEEKIDSKIVETLANKLEEVPESLNDISNGTDQILNGAQSLNSGLQQINDGTNTLDTKYTEFDKGINSAYEGSNSLNSGISQVSTGIDTLQKGSSTLDDSLSLINSGINELSTKESAGINELVTGLKELSTGATKLSNGISTIATSLNTGLSNNENQILQKAHVSSIDELNSNVSALKSAITVYGVDAINPSSGNTYLDDYKNLCQAQGAISALESTKTSITQSANDKTSENSLYALNAGAKQLDSGLKQITSEDTITKLNDITNGINSLKIALGQVKQGTSTLNAGIDTLHSGSIALKLGSSELNNGLYTLNTNSKLIKTALNTLNDGTQTAYNGSTQLVNGIKAFKSEVNNGIKNTNEQLQSLNGINDFAQNPVDFETQAYGKVNSYGIAFTPLFICIGLWVGALMAYVVLYYDQKNRFTIFGSINNNKLLQNILYIGLGAIQGIITGLLLKFGLSYEVENMILYLFANALIGITFMSIIQFLIRNFGDIGKFLALIILVLQLAASGGTFPIETINKFFQGMTPYLPMTYSIKLLREILVPTATNFKGQYIIVLIVINILCIGITYIVDIIKNKKIEKSEK